MHLPSVHLLNFRWYIGSQCKEGWFTSWNVKNVNPSSWSVIWCNQSITNKFVVNLLFTLATINPTCFWCNLQHALPSCLSPSSHTGGGQGCAHARQEVQKYTVLYLCLLVSLLSKPSPHHSLDTEPSFPQKGPGLAQAQLLALKSTKGCKWDATERNWPS